MSTSSLARKSLDQEAEQGPNAEEFAWLAELPVPQETECTGYNTVITNLKYYYWGGIEIHVKHKRQNNLSCQSCSVSSWDWVTFREAEQRFFRGLYVVLVGPPAIGWRWIKTLLWIILQWAERNFTFYRDIILIMIRRFLFSSIFTFF
jgi:hypothetical protein